MNTKDFRYRAIAWLRDQMSVETHCLPHEEIEDDDGTAVIDGDRVAASRANPFRGQALVFFSCSYGLGLAAGNGLSAHAKLLLGVCSGLFAVIALGLLIASFWQRRGRRTPVFVKLFNTRAPIGEATVRAVQRKAKRRDAWIVSASGFTSDAVAMAAELGVRCFAFDDRFVEQASQPASQLLARAA